MRAVCGGIGKNKPASSVILDRYSFRSSSTLFRPSAMYVSNFMVNRAMRSRRSSKPKFMLLGRVEAVFCCCCCCCCCCCAVEGGSIDWRVFVVESVVSYRSDIFAGFLNGAAMRWFGVVDELWFCLLFDFRRKLKS